MESEKIKIYWVVFQKKNKAVYFLDNPIENTSYKEALIDNKYNYTGFSIYELDTIITDEVLISLLNGKFNHCLLPYYQNAKRIYHIPEENEL